MPMHITGLRLEECIVKKEALGYLWATKPSRLKLEQNDKKHCNPFPFLFLWRKGYASKGKHKEWKNWEGIGTENNCKIIIEWWTMILMVPLFTVHNHRFPLTWINFYLPIPKATVLQSQFISGRRKEISFRQTFCHNGIACCLRDFLYWMN